MLDVVWKKALTPEERGEYDAFVREAPGGHYAQTRAWEPVVRASRPAATRYALVRDGGRILGTALVTRGALGPCPLPVAWVERGPVCRNPADLAGALSALTRAARRHGVLRLSVMPYFAGNDAELAEEVLRDAGFRDVQRSDGAHARTLRIPLDTVDARSLLFAAGQEGLRRRKTQAEKAGATARRGTRGDFELHRRLTQEMMRAQGKRTRPPRYYDALWTNVLGDGSGGALFVCECDGQVLATVVVLRHARFAVYAEGATTRTPHRISKSVLPLLAAIAWARAEGCAEFDLGGIPLENDTDDKRRAIAKMKLDFARAPVRLVREHARLF